MRPTVSDQLQQTIATLQRTVRPAVDDAFADEVLRRILADLRKLGDCWDRAVPFLQWDVQRTMALLGDHREHLSDDQRLRLESWQNTDLQDLDGAALSAVQQELRGVLVSLVPALMSGYCGDAAPAQLVAYFDERLRRDPMSNRRPAPQRSV